jgi:hypothetical protein
MIRRTNMEPDRNQRTGGCGRRFLFAADTYGPLSSEFSSATLH